MLVDQFRYLYPGLKRSQILKAIAQANAAIREREKWNPVYLRLMEIMRQLGIVSRDARKSGGCDCSTVECTSIDKHVAENVIVGAMNELYKMAQDAIGVQNLKAEADWRLKSLEHRYQHRQARYGRVSWRHPWGV